MVIKFPLATMLDFLQEQLTVILRYSLRQKSFYPNDGILGEHFFFLFPLSNNGGRIAVIINV